MKFLCDKCKAKYQISDDKLTGKTVRMKCRKCEHMIEVRAAVTETSIAGEPTPAPARAPLATTLAHAKAPAAKPSVAPPPSSRGGWYAAIEGSPTGPMPLAELRSRVAGGSVSGGSLVWEEGTDEWRPARTVPGLASALRDAARPAAPPPRARSASSGRSATSVAATGARGVEPSSHAGRIAAQGSTGAYASGAATAEKLEIAIAPTPAPVPEPEPIPVPVAAPQVVEAPPPAAPAPPAAAPRRQPNYLGIGVVVGFAAFGVTLALTLQKPPAPVAPPPSTIIQLQAPPAPQPVAPRPTETAAPDTAPKVAASPSHGAKPVAKGAPAPKLEDAKLLDPGLLSPGLAGGPDSAPAPKPVGPSLTQKQIEDVVNGYKLAVRRSCYDRLGNVGTANENVHLTIDASGRATSVTADGDNGTVGRCLEREIGRWKFPESGGTTPVSLPFHFVSQ